MFRSFFFKSNIQQIFSGGDAFTRGFNIWHATSVQTAQTGFLCIVANLRLTSKHTDLPSKPSRAPWSRRLQTSCATTGWASTASRAPVRRREELCEPGGHESRAETPATIGRCSTLNTADSALPLLYWAWHCVTEANIVIFLPRDKWGTMKVCCHNSNTERDQLARGR